MFAKAINSIMYFLVYIGNSSLMVKDEGRHFILHFNSSSKVINLLIWIEEVQLIVSYHWPLLISFEAILATIDSLEELKDGLNRTQGP